MEVWLWTVIGSMAVIIIVLIIKIDRMQRSVKNIASDFAERLITDTNTLIDTASRDKYIRQLTNEINRQLRKLREQRHRFEQGDSELKNAVTNISHDLRTPLTAIWGYLDLLEEEKMSESVAKYIEMIRNRAELLSQLTEELFRYSVILAEGKELTKEPVVLNGVLEESIAAFYAVLTERGITPEIRMPHKKVIRVLDCSALSRVFSNLLNNALKYSDGDLEITLSENGEMDFVNQASGLDEVQVGKLFDRFYTVEAARKSTGLGLSIAKTLVEQMGGSITAQYEKERLKIRVYFPEEGTE
ncbi:MAG: HAMP domain-containing sensor histidine kinase [Lachnospiraceae bacterium]|nr:HAMP domain-containing sensor histidine kinase [Lachnospiraceae bacterium]